MKRCHRCGAPWVSDKTQPGVKEYCDTCSSYYHCCLNCRFHDTSRPNECYIPGTEGIADRAGANFCDEFEFLDAETEKANKVAQTDAERAFFELFGEEPQPPDKPKALEDLFP